MKKTLSLLGLIATISLALSACGGAAAPSTTLEVTMTDFQFTPNKFTIPAGQEITLNAANNGAVEHTFIIFKLGANAGDKFGDEDRENIYWEAKALPGESITVTFTAPAEPGEYYLTCGIPGHHEAGMSGSITVVAGK